MWPLHVRTKDEYIRLIQGYLEREEREPLGSALSAAFEDYQDEEDFAAWCAGVAHGMETGNAMNIIARFVERFPLSLHPIQVDLADLLVRHSQVDEGANEARSYLNRLHEVGLADCISKAELVRDGCSRAFLLLTAVYTEAGARTYSTRLIEFALLLEHDPFWRRRFQTEYMRLGDELRQPELADLDRRWEHFFGRGEGGEELHAHSRKANCPILAKRVSVLASRFKADPKFQMDEAEYFQLLFRTDKGAFVLV